MTGPSRSYASTAEVANTTVEDTYWKENYTNRHYVDLNRPYEDYGPAYRYGWESRGRLGERNSADVESDLERGWSKARGPSQLVWDQAKHATRDAWQLTNLLDRLGPRSSGPRTR